MLDGITLFRLRVFTEVVDAGGFRIAAERLNISQPAVSAHMQNLESLLSVVLMERGKGGELTEAGQYFYKYAKTVLQQTNEITQIISELHNAQFGRVTLGAAATLGRYMVPKIFSSFKMDNPFVELILHLGTAPKISQLVLNREIDFGFIIGKYYCPGTTMQMVAADQLVIVSGANHPLANQTSISPEEISEQPFITAIKESSHNDILENILKNNGIYIQKRLMELQDADSIKRVLEEGLGLGVLLKCSVLQELNSGTLKEIKVSATPPMMVGLYLVVRPDKYISPTVNKFLQFFKANLKYYDHN